MSTSLKAELLLTQKSIPINIGKEVFLSSMNGELYNRTKKQSYNIPANVITAVNPHRGTLIVTTKIVISFWLLATIVKLKTNTAVRINAALLIICENEYTGRV